MRSDVGACGLEFRLPVRFIRRFTLLIHPAPSFTHDLDNNLSVTRPVVEVDEHDLLPCSRQR